MPIPPVVYNARNLRIDPFNTELACDALLHGLRATANYPRWIDSGTLLGLVRDGHFIKHDTDVDIAVCLTTDEALEIELPSNEVVRTIYWHHLPMQHAYLERGIIVDLYFYYPDIEAGYLVNFNTDGVLRIPANLILPIAEDFSWRGHQLPVPRATREFLAWSYGESWTTPKTSKGNWASEHSNLDGASLADTWQLPPRHERIAGLLRDANDARDQARASRDEALAQRDTAFRIRNEATAARDLARASRRRTRKRLKTIQQSRAWRAASRYYDVRDRLRSSQR